MRRRDLIAGLGGVLAWPLVARAQTNKPVIGFVNAASPKRYTRQLGGFLKGLGEQGFVEGRNVVIEYRWGEEHNDRLPAMVADLIERKVAVIAATSAPAAIAARKATTTIPIVFETGLDPVEAGLVSSLDRPGGNVTGVTQMNIGLTPKRFEFLHELLPKAKLVALMVNPTDGRLAKTTVDEAQDAAKHLGLEIRVFNVISADELDSAFAKVAEAHVGGLVISGGAFFTAYSVRLAALTQRYAVPAIFQYREFTAAGGLASYGSDITESYRLAGVFCGHILKGEKPADLPVQQATKVELYINTKAAKALGLTLPITLLGRADEVFE